MEDQNAPPALKPRKRPRNEETWKCNRTKLLKATGQEHLTYKTRVNVGPRQMLDVDCSHHCGRNLTPEEKLRIFTDFNNLGHHEKQNIYLRGCLNYNGTHKKYLLRVESKFVNVCEKFFTGIHGIKRSRLVSKVLNLNATIQDLRGKHGSHNRTEATVLNSVRAFLNQLPGRESHYSRGSNKNRKYLESKTSVKSLYNDFLRDENNNVAPQQLKLWQFRKIFNYEFNFGFGHPRSDICESCEIYNAQIQGAIAINDNEEHERLALLQVEHWMESELFYRRMNIQDLQNFDDTHVFICFDCQKNFPFPVTNCNKEFFLRQMWMYNFGVHNMKTGQSYMFLYCEHFAKKGCNEIISFVKYFIEHFLDERVRNLHVFADNAFGQNKNRFLLAYLQSLCPTRFDNIFMEFPVPGHSRMSVDTDFALIEKKKRKVDKILFPSQWVDLIKAAKINTPNIIIYGQNYITDDLTDDGTPIAEVLDFKRSLENILRPSAHINEIRRIHFSKDFANRNPRVRKSMEGECDEEYILLKRQVTQSNLCERIEQANRAYDNFIPVSSEKYENIQTLLATFNIPNEKIFYDFISPTEFNEVDDRVRDIINEFADPAFNIDFLG